MTNSKAWRTTEGRVLDADSVIEWAMGWNDGISGAPWREIASGRMNYEFGRLYASEAKAAGLPVKPWRPRVTRQTGKVRVPRFIPSNFDLGGSPIPPRHVDRA